MVQEASRLVSVIMPLYNCEAYVSEAIESVINQSYPNIELIIVDDCSTDASYKTAEKYTCDARVKLFKNDVNQGAARTRTAALKHANGSFVAYMDSDDVWLPTKIEEQIKYMRQEDASMCFTAYETILEDGSHINYVYVPHKISYREFLKNTITCSHTIMFDLRKIPLDSLMSPSDRVEYDYPEDLDTWLRILNQGEIGYGLNQVLAQYRKRRGSRSSNKLAAVSRTWNQYRKREQLSVQYSAYCLFWQLFHAILKRI